MNIALPPESTGEVSFPLLDGATGRLRRLTPADFDDVVSLADSLSEEESYRRFFAVHPSYVDEWATSLTEPCSGDIALGAYEDGRLIGVGNYAVGAVPASAEIAVVVAHHHHDRGVGTALLGELGSIARQHGIHHLTADVLAENSPMRLIIRKSPWFVALHRNGTVLDVDVDLDQSNTVSEVAQHHSHARRSLNVIRADEWQRSLCRAATGSS